MEYHIEHCGQDEVLIVAESPIGFRRWMIEYPLDKKYEVQHELGGVPSWVLTRKTYFDAKPRLVCGPPPGPPQSCSRERRPSASPEMTRFGSRSRARREART